MAHATLRDTFGRNLRNLRLSVTDRCNLRCAYCMPEETYPWLPSSEILSFEELSRLVDVFCALGVDRIRLTGGEPLVRRELSTLVRLLSSKPLTDLALTTNGVLLTEQAQALAEAGLKRVTVSLDTLKAERFFELTRRDLHARVLEGIAAARGAGLKTGLKLDAVVMRGINDDELPALLDYAAQVGAELRFIEYMDVGGATRWSANRVVTKAQILALLTRELGAIEPLSEQGSSAPAERFRLRDGRVFGIISSVSAPFCSSCDRARLTADGHLFTCLYATQGVDLRAALRSDASAEQLQTVIAQTWRRRSDRGAETRLKLDARAPLFTAAELRADPHREMHTRGG